MVLARLPIFRKLDPVQNGWKTIFCTVVKDSGDCLCCLVYNLCRADPLLGHNLDLLRAKQQQLLTVLQHQRDGSFEEFNQHADCEKVWAWRLLHRVLDQFELDSSFSQQGQQMS